jgi:hypothetical protein
LFLTDNARDTEWQFPEDFLSPKLLRIALVLLLPDLAAGVRV